MRVIDGIRYLELHELEAIGISYDRLKKARARNSAGYTIIDDPADRRRILTKYDDLKPSIKLVVDAVHGGSVAKSRQAEWVSAFTPQVTDLAALRSHKLPDDTYLPEQVATKCAIACNVLRLVNNTSVKTMRGWGYANAAEWYAEVLARINAEKLPLPTKNARALLAKGREYASSGENVTCVVSKKYGNDNSRKIYGAQHAWIVSMYAQPTKPDTAKLAVLYNAEAKLKGWPSLTETAIYQHLHKPEVKQVWYMGRHGKGEWKGQFQHLMKNRMPTFRDALWCSDGTKLNYFYQDEKGMKAKMQMYFIVDVYSEAIIGYSYALTENFHMQAQAARVALKTSGHRPLQWLYDGQSGHKSGAQQEFFSRAAKLHFPAEPYNANSKPIENLFGRIQTQVMRPRWFYTGQNIEAKSINSKPNAEFIKEHNRDLPTATEVVLFAKEDIETWNSMPHPKTKVPRMMMYQESVNPQAQELTFLDMVELFWHFSTRPIQYTNKGLRIEVGGHRLEYEVVRQGMPDMEFLRQYTQARFHVAYDIEDLSSVRLYKRDDSGELRYVATAQTKQAFARAVVDLKPGEREEIDAHLSMRKEQKRRIEEELKELRGESKVDPETLVYIRPTMDKHTTSDTEGDLLVHRVDDDYFEKVDVRKGL